MSKKVKTRWIGTRVDEAQSARIGAYIEAGDKTLGEVIRDALDNYIALYPVKPLPPSKVKLTTKEK